eukprot:368910_1
MMFRIGKHILCVYLVLFLVYCINTVCSFNITIAMLQIPVGFNLANIEYYLSIASNNKSDIAILPSSTFNGSCISWNEITKNWCLKYNLAISISCNNNNKIEAMVTDKFGNIILNYTKPDRNGEDPNIRSSLLTLSNNTFIQIGVILEDDIYFPEITRSLMLQGTHLVLYMTKGIVTTPQDDILLYTRGSENLNIIARVNRASSNHSNENGRSAIGSNLTNHVTNQNYFITNPVDNKPQVIITKFDINYIYNARKINHMGDNLRRPFHYKLLCNLTTVPLRNKNYNKNIYSLNGKDIIVKVAALQINSGNTIDENIKIADTFVRKAANMGADIAFMPEMYSVGYLEMFPGYKYANMTSLDEVYNWINLSQTKYENFIEHFRNLSKELSISIGATFLEKSLYSTAENQYEISPLNSIILFDKNGNELYTYSKVHTVGDAYNEALTSGGYTWYVNQLDLDDERGVINIGSEICFDQDQPESARILNLLNVEIILHSNACRYTDGLHYRLRTRAIENKIGIIMANYPYPTAGGMNGNSCAYNWNGDVISIANDTQQIVMAEFNVTDIRMQRINDLKPVHRIKRLCDFQRQQDFIMTNTYKRVSGCTV